MQAAAQQVFINRRLQHARKNDGNAGVPKNHAPGYGAGSLSYRADGPTAAQHQIMQASQYYSPRVGNAAYQ